MPNTRPRHRNKDYESLFKEAERQGWVIQRTKKNHFRLLCPSECGQHIVVASSTPSDHRSLRNVRSRMRECERTKI